jgi:hypothetical protein
MTMLWEGVVWKMEVYGCRGVVCGREVVEVTVENDEQMLFGTVAGGDYGCDRGYA